MIRNDAEGERESGKSRDAVGATTITKETSYSVPHITLESSPF